MPARCRTYFKRNDNSDIVDWGNPGYKNKLTIGQLIAFQMFANQFSAPVMRLVNLWNEFQQVLLGVDRLGDILNNPVEVTSDKAITLPKINGFVRVDNLSFKYTPNSPLVLDKINLKVNAGQSVGLVGRSGSGKSTITKLIQKLYLPLEGTIYIDEVDIRQMNPIWLRNNIGVVLQENYLFLEQYGRIFRCRVRMRRWK